jgi:hypothetical protein
VSWFTDFRIFVPTIITCFMWFFFPIDTKV